MIRLPYPWQSEIVCRCFFNWQGREFYIKLGYEEVGQYSSPQDGFSELFFKKDQSVFAEFAKTKL